MVSFWEGKVGDVGEGRCLFVITRGLYGCGFSMRVDLNEAAQGWEGTRTMKMFPAISSELLRLFHQSPGNLCTYERFVRLTFIKWRE